MKIVYSPLSTIRITDDDDVLARAKDVNLDDVDISELRINADTLHKVYDDAIKRHDVESAAKYKKLKQAFLAQFPRV